VALALNLKLLQTFEDVCLLRQPHDSHHQQHLKHFFFVAVVILLRVCARVRQKVRERERARGGGGGVLHKEQYLVFRGQGGFSSEVHVRPLHM
jgi:hypothetical protein